MSKKNTYKNAGVDIDEADKAIDLIKQHASKTMTSKVITGIGSFGAGFSLEGWSSPVLISSADGVGTKLKIAFASGKHTTIGEDLVNHCVNDIAVQGAKPLFFLDYFATGELSAKICSEVVSGIARGCKKNGCALIGGETAEMPGMYIDGEYDLAGFIVGAVEKDNLLTGHAIVPGDLLIGLPSTGLHTNGYSLARQILQNAYPTGIPSILMKELLRVHRSYLKPVQLLHKKGFLKGAAHITGGGLTDNIPRILPKNCSVEINLGSWPILPIFGTLQELGNIPSSDLRRTFNLGIGMVLVIDSGTFNSVSQTLNSLREPFYTIGRVVPVKSKKQRVTYIDINLVKDSQ